MILFISPQAQFSFSGKNKTSLSFANELSVSFISDDELMVLWFSQCSVKLMGFLFEIF